MKINQFIRPVFVARANSTTAPKDSSSVSSLDPSSTTISFPDPPLPSFSPQPASPPAASPQPASPPAAFPQSASPPAASPQPSGGDPASPVFLTPQSIASFPGASLAINILWNLVAVFNKNIAKLPIVPIGLAFLVGLTIYFISINPGMSRKDKQIGFVIGIFNSVWLGLNALGINIIQRPTD